MRFLTMRARRIGYSGAAFATVVSAVIAVPAASAQFAEVQLQTDNFAFAPQRPPPDADGKTLPSSVRRGTKGWIALHRPDGEVLYIKVDQIVFVMTAKATGAAERSRSKIQLLNGYTDVRESVEDVMQAIDDEVTLTSVPGKP
jgi:hypothetical protein